MKKVTLLIVTYVLTRGLKRVVVGRNKDWKQHVNLLSPRGWLPTKVALLQSGLVPAVGTRVALPTHNTQAFSVAA